MIKKYLQLFLKKKRIALPILILIVAGTFFVVRGNGTQEYKTVVVGYAENLSKTVSVTGKVESAQGVRLAFEMSGKVAKLSVVPGQKVKEGEVLASLSNGDIAAQVSQARSNVDSARSQLENLRSALAIQQAKLDELRLGARPEEVSVVQAKVDSAQRAFEDAQTSYDATVVQSGVELANLYNGSNGVVQDAYAKDSDSLSKQIDEFFFNDTTDAPTLTFLVVETQAKYAAETGRVSANKALIELEKITTSRPTTEQAIELQLENTLKQTAIIRDYLNSLQSAVNAAVGLPQATLTSYQTSISTARAQAVAAHTAVSQRLQAIASQKAAQVTNLGSVNAQLNVAANNLALAKSELNLKKAGATAEQIRIQEGYVAQAKSSVASGQAQVSYAQASVRQASATYSKSTLTSPVNGVVGKINIKKGEIANALEDAIVVVSDSKYEIKTNIAEVDLAQISVGNKASVTLDAYASTDTFAATVVSVDPSETLVNNITTYVATLHFERHDERIRAGMTANIVITGEEKTNVLVAPTRAIMYNEANQKVIKVLTAKGKKKIVVEHLVITGLEGSDGMTEIVEGISEGDEIVIAD